MEVATIEVKTTHGKVEVIATGRTGRGQRYIKDTRVLDIPSISDKNFKAEMAAAVTAMLASEA